MKKYNKLDGQDAYKDTEDIIDSIIKKHKKIRSKKDKNKKSK